MAPMLGRVECILLVYVLTPFFWSTPTVGNATLSNGTEWQGNVYNTTVEWVEAGVLLNATSDGINHPSVALEGQPSQDGRVAVLTVRQLQSGSSK